MAESYLPSVNGVTMSVVRSMAHLESLGHTVRVLAPGSAGPMPAHAEHLTLPGDVQALRSMALPRYRSLRVAVPTRTEIGRAIDDFQPDVVHLAAPALFGGRVADVCRRRGIPAVAVFQTDLAGFVLNYRGLRWTAKPLWHWIRRLHDRAELTLAPTPTVAQDLRVRGFSPVDVWGRGVDLDQFDPGQRSEARRNEWAVGDRLAVGFVGRLAAEKRVERLAALGRHPDLRLVIVGDGPERANLEAALPDAHFTGMLAGHELGEAMASLDLFVHTGEHETFCQTIQEAMASGVPVVAPAAGGPVDLVDPGVTGELFRPGDDADLVAKVEALATDRDRRERMAVAGLTAVQHRTWNSVSNRLVGHYRRAMAADEPLVLTRSIETDRTDPVGPKWRGAVA